MNCFLLFGFLISQNHSIFSTVAICFQFNNLNYGLRMIFMLQKLKTSQFNIDLDHCTGDLKQQSIWVIFIVFIFFIS